MSAHTTSIAAQVLAEDLRAGAVAPLDEGVLPVMLLGRAIKAFWLFHYMLSFQVGHPFLPGFTFSLFQCLKFRSPAVVK